jgi:hypothetical protein
MSKSVTNVQERKHTLNTFVIKKRKSPQAFSVNRPLGFLK